MDGKMIFSFALPLQRDCVNMLLGNKWILNIHVKKISTPINGPQNKRGMDYTIDKEMM